MRRLPVYLLLDCSESMIGDGVNAVQEGLETMLRALRTDPHALETVWLSCIAFDSQARLLFPLTELTEVQAPKLSVRPGTAIGAALSLCANRIRSEVRRTTPTQKGDWRPLIVLLTDGQATDDVGPGLLLLGQKIRPRPANIYAIGCGEDVDIAGLQQITDIVLHLADMSEDQIRRLFVWLTASVTESSRGVHDVDEPGKIQLTKLPDNIVKVDHQVSPYEGPARQVFLYARCSKSKQPYLMRYKFAEEYDAYFPVAAHRMDVETVAAREDFTLPTINSAQISGAPPCPYCEATGAGSCGNCGAVFCSDPRNHEGVVCPGCGAQLRMRSPNERQGDFEIRQSLS